MRPEGPRQYAFVGLGQARARVYVGPLEDQADFRLAGSRQAGAIYLMFVTRPLGACSRTQTRESVQPARRAQVAGRA